jgi:hypothetical protein
MFMIESVEDVLRPALGHEALSPSQKGRETSPYREVARQASSSKLIGSSNSADPAVYIYAVSGVPQVCR